MVFDKIESFWPEARAFRIVLENDLLDKKGIEELTGVVLEEVEKVAEEWLAQGVEVLQELSKVDANSSKEELNNLRDLLDKM